MLGLGALSPKGLEGVGALKPGGSGMGSSFPTLCSNKVQVQEECLIISRIYF